jgi:hypothetical protein
MKNYRAKPKIEAGYSKDIWDVIAEDDPNQTSLFTGTPDECIKFLEERHGGEAKVEHNWDQHSLSRDLQDECEEELHNVEDWFQQRVNEGVSDKLVLHQASDLAFAIWVSAAMHLAEREGDNVVDYINDNFASFILRVSQLQTQMAFVNEAMQAEEGLKNFVEAIKASGG